MGIMRGPGWLWREVGLGGADPQAWGWPDTPIHTFDPCPSDLKALSQTSKAPREPPFGSPVVEQVQPVMAPNIPATPGRTGRWDWWWGTW